MRDARRKRRPPGKPRRFRARAGIYYPALSLYAGGKAKANFGPEWICPPQCDTPMQPISALKATPGEDADGDGAEAAAE